MVKWMKASPMDAMLNVVLVGIALTRQLMKGILTMVDDIVIIEFTNNFNERAHTSQLRHSIFLIYKSWLKDKW